MIASVAPMVADRSRAPERLLVAVVVSFLLHAALLVGIPVNPTGGVPGVNSVITARLEPAAEEQPRAETTTEAPVPVPAQKSSSPDPLAEPAPKKPEPRPENKPAVAPPSTPSTGVEMPLARDPTYYAARQLDVLPEPVFVISPKCPPAAENDRVDGTVVLLLLINEFGIVDDAGIVEATPKGYSLDEAAAVAFRPARFIPAEKDGRRVKSRFVIRVRFTCDLEKAHR